MNPADPDPFGQPLRPDPSVALPQIDVGFVQKSGPLHKVQYVIEFVGPRSIPAPAAAHLLGTEWYRALGQPTVFAMRPADLHWQPLTTSPDGSYDSLAVAWDLVHPRGTLSSSAAEHLLATAERFAPFIQRRAMPLPPPVDVNKVVSALTGIREALDIGFALNIVGPTAGLPEKALWIEFSRLGLSFGSAGGFEWRVPNVAEPLLEVTPFGLCDTFSLANVKTGMSHQGVTIGFSLPLCPAPAQALKGAFYIAQAIVRRLGGTIHDQDDVPVTDRIQNEYRDNMREALGLFARAGMVTGSPEAVKLFSS